jgi:hypothetical protein
MAENPKKPIWNIIPTDLTEKEFNEIVLPLLHVPSREPSPNLSIIPSLIAFSTLCIQDVNGKKV